MATSEKRVMLGRDLLRVDPNNGSSGVEYRIEMGTVERRSIGKRAQRNIAAERQWQRLEPEQVASDVLANGVVGHWLLRRLGIRTLIRACIRHTSSE